MGSLVSFYLTHPYNTQEQSYSQGFASGCVAAFLSLLSSVLFLIDSILLRRIEKAYSGHHQKLIFSFQLALVYVILGGFIFEYLEGWSYEKATQFVIVTLLTIGTPHNRLLACNFVN